ncbi:PAS domain-containing sensor histidine kinase [Lutibaculum baratangense]|uniref:histidine kinase n=1 Tax=Lutibaculum baratangense AMV1 TaxID=631454 RepID=V4RE79_9HYPH|nr:histidine kinase dimerization/phospho-acceptor domain-containing protein [Lutibaculum baratangense]ESR23699.1 hypothetical protein N177_2929 [Lutibaculum baratangense AMV1]
MRGIMPHLSSSNRSRMSVGLALEDVLSDPRLKDIALGDQPAWAWDVASSHVVFANAGGVALLGCGTLAELRHRGFGQDDIVAQQIIRLAATVPADGGARMAMLRLPPGPRPIPTACRCRRLTVAGRDLVLFVAVGAGADQRPLAERLGMLFGGIGGPVRVLRGEEEFYAGSVAGAAGEPVSRFVLPSSEGDLTVEVAEAAGEPAGGPHALSPLHGAFDPSKAPVVTAEGVAERGEGEAPELPEDEAEQAGPASEQADSPASLDNGASDDAAEPEREVIAAEEASKEVANTAPSSGESRPRRFTFELDAAGTVVEVGPALREVAGASGAVQGRNWSELAQAYRLDPDGEISRLMDTRETWSGIVVDWPRESGGSVGVRLSALPRFSGDRQFAGYRGFGEILEAEPVAEAGERPDAPQAVDEAEGEPRGEAAEVPEDHGAVFANVLRLHSTQAREPVPDVRLNERERNAFQAIARALGARLPYEASEDGEGGVEPAREAAPSPDVATADEPAPAALAAEPGDEPGAPPGRAGEQAERPAADPARLTQELLARVPWGLAVVRDEHVIYANRAFLQTFGFTDLDDLEIAGGLPAILAGRSAEEAGSATVRARRRDGTMLDVEARLSRVDWVDGPAMLVSVRAGEQTTPLKAEIAKLRSVLELAADGMLTLDRGWRVAGMNRAAEDLVGEPETGLTGRPFLSLVAAESRAVAEDYLEALFGSRPVLEEGIEIVIEAETGPVPVHVRGALVEDGRFPQVCVILRDLRRWKTAEAEALTARRRAEQANEKKSDFLAKMSHEIRTPLNAIIGFAEVMLEERFGALENERYRDYLSDIRESGEHIMSLINDLLDLSKVEAGRMDLAFTGVRLGEIVEQTVAIMQPQANRQRVIIRTSLAMDVPQVVADARSLRQVMMNLLSNGIKFTPPGGQVIVSSVVTPAGEVALRVRDTGVGMTAEETELALEPFRQVGARSESTVKGSGLGLPLTKALVEANRARFRIASEPGEGTLVEITFPKARIVGA